MSKECVTRSSVARILQSQEMPAEEIRAVLDAEDAQTVHRYLELHRERLEERLAEQRRLVIDLERSLTERVIGHRREVSWSSVLQVTGARTRRDDGARVATRRPRRDLSVRDRGSSNNPS